MRTRRYASVWLPNWPAQRLARQPGKTLHEPFLVARTTGQQRLVHAVSPQANDAGLRAGTTVALAQARVTGLTVVEANLAEDEAALRRIAIWALRYSPLVAVEEPDGIVLDTGGTEHLFGGESELLIRLLTQFTEQELRARGAISASRLLSWALARFGTHTEAGCIVVPPGREAAAAAPLPVAALGMEPEVTNTLRRLGFDRVEQLFAAPRAGLALRFGTGLMRRLDRLTAREPETLEPLSAPELLHSQMVFAEPIAHTAGVEGALGHLAEKLCETLADQGRGVRTLDLRATRVDGNVSVVRIGTAAPNRDPGHLCRLFKEKLDRIDPGFGIERMALAAPLTERMEAKQLGTAGERKVDLASLVDRIASRIGKDHVFRMAATERDMPERSFRPVSPLTAREGLVWDRRPRPVQLIAPPQRIEVLALVPDHPPARFTWGGRQHRVRKADGPECIFGEWWLARDEVALTRDYYRVEDDEGGRYWLFRARDTATGQARWFVHGVFG
jgi:protein ImuB